MESLQAAGIQEGDCLTAVVQQPKMTATEQAFVVWCCGGNKVASWGASDSGGDCSTVQDQLKNVQQNQQILAVELFIFMEKRECARAFTRRCNIVSSISGCEKS